MSALTPHLHPSSHDAPPPPRADPPKRVGAALFALLLGGGAAAAMAHVYLNLLVRIESAGRTVLATIRTPGRTLTLADAYARAGANSPLMRDTKDAVYMLGIAAALGVLGAILARVGHRTPFVARLASFLAGTALLSAIVTFAVNYDHLRHAL